MRGEVPGQKPDRDIFNKPNPENQALIPTKFRGTK
jgi:hypothetical protein